MFESERLRTIFAKTDGACHLCWKKLSFSNYGALNGRGAWEVDHSVPRAAGGTNHGNNLFPACVACNRSKQAASSRAARRASGVTRAPRSLAAQARVRERHVRKGFTAGLLSGGAVAGPFGALVGGVLGGLLGGSGSKK